jgi:hypothetical protein
MASLQDIRNNNPYDGDQLNGDEIFLLEETDVPQTQGITAQEIVDNLPQNGLLLSEIDELPGYDSDILDGTETLPIYEDDEGQVEKITVDDLLRKTSNNIETKRNFISGDKDTHNGGLFLRRTVPDEVNGVKLVGGGEDCFIMPSLAIGKRDATTQLDVSGTITGSSKNFLIDHPTPDKSDTHTLRHGSLEGPENGVYFRGTVQGGGKIDLPAYWPHLIDPATITVNLTAIGSFQQLYVVDKSDDAITLGIGNGSITDIHCDYTVYAERSDVDSLTVEEEK